MRLRRYSTVSTTVALLLYDIVILYTVRLSHFPFWLSSRLLTGVTFVRLFPSA